ncbi:unnamed protein product [Allacma fusca]|uniref:Uncharacterized protein n=1 Tax=Allacma fusca TaxID=39272 RepID=A0A8J2LGQ0_9HEXA|nr:unnamed protein product [Allacma fusca]
MFAWLGTLAQVTLIIALVSLILTAVIDSLLIDIVNLHSWTRLSFVTSQFVFLLLFALHNSRWIRHPELNPALCQAFGITYHYSGLVTLCWLSVLNFDLYWTFKVLKPTRSVKFDHKRFICYVCFALGVPLIVVLTAVGIQNSKSKQGSPVCRKDVEEHMSNFNGIYPEYGKNFCSLSVASSGKRFFRTSKKYRIITKIIPTIESKHVITVQGSSTSDASTRV